MEHSITPGRYEESKAQLRRLALDSLKKTLYDHKLDAIVGPTDSPLASIAASAGTFQDCLTISLTLIVFQVDQSRLFP